MRSGDGATAYIVRRDSSISNERATTRRKKGAHFELEAVDAHGYGPDHARVEFLIVRLALGRSDVREFPLEIWR